jgi:3-deoxy-D-manno-octulosonic-acid transferase
MISELKKYKKAYWFHVASHGELEQVISVIKHLRSLTSHKIVVSYFSPTAKKAIDNEKNKMGEIFWDYTFALPFDFSFLLNLLMKTLEPTQFIAVHREFWPALLFQLKKQAIPCSLINTYITPNKKISMTFLKLFQKISTVDKASKDFFLSKFPNKNIQCFGDTRVDRIIDRLKQNKNSYPLYNDEKINIVWASLWEEDYKIIRDCFSPLYRHFIVPHEIHETFLKKIRCDFKDKNFPLHSFGQSGQYILVDKVGFLLELYSLTKIAFVGGSFKAKVHSVLEPIVAGNCVLSGPFIGNSIQAINLQKEGTLHVFKTASEINTFLKNYRQSAPLTLEKNSSKQVANWLIK